MNFFDELIKNAEELAAPFKKAAFSYNAAKTWRDAGESHIIFQRDTAFELDGTGFNLVTSSPLGESKTLIAGDDLKSVNKNRRFARVSVIEIDDVGDEQKAYNLIRKIEYVKYHYFPEGYMIRTSSSEQKEIVRVSKKAVIDGISFEKVGNLLTSKFLENSSVKNVRTYFITAPSFDYKALDALAEKNAEITKTLNHIMQNVTFDCAACNLKPICDEVEGMRELHFKKGKRM